jgi:hypothetical protein
VLFTASSFFCSSVFILFTGDLNPFWFQRMLRTHKTRQINCQPVASRKRHDPFNLNPEIGARPRQAVTALGR